MGKLERLPNELLEWIVDNCNYEDWKSLRATCKAFHFTDAGIFETIHVAFSTTSLDRFDYLTRNPRLASLIKSVDFVGDILPEIDSVQQYEDLIDLREPWSKFSERFMRDNHDIDSRQLAHKAYKSLPLHELCPDDLSVHFEKYESFRLQQQLGWGSEHDHLFIEAFCRLLNLSMVGNQTYSFSDNNERFPWRKLQKEILLGPNDWMRVHAIEADDEDQDTRRFEDPIHMRHVRCILQAISRRDASPEARALEEVKLYNMGAQSFYDLGIPVDFSVRSPSVPSAFKGFQDLTTLRLNVSYHIRRLTATGTVQDDRAIQLFGEILGMLRGASNLEILVLEAFDEMTRDDEETLMFPEDTTLHQLQIPKLEHLHHLTLTCTASERNLLTVLHNHAQTLRELRLIDMDLEPGTWQSLIEKLPNILRLEHVYLEGLRDEDIMDGEEGLFEDGLGDSLVPISDWNPHDQAVHKFILNGGHMPALNIKDWLVDRDNRNLHDDYLLACKRAWDASRASR